MKKNVLSFLLLIVLFLLSGCGRPALIGHWIPQTANVGELTFGTDNKITLSIYDETIQGTYEINENNVVLQIRNPITKKLSTITHPFSVDKDTLSMNGILYQRAKQ